MSEMTKERFIQVMRSRRDRWLALLNSIPHSEMGESGVEGVWSVRDLIIHVTAYERGLVEWLEAASAGEVKEFPILDHEDIDFRNMRILEQNSELSAEEAARQAGEIFERLMDLIEATSEEDLLDPEKVEWYVKPRWKRRREPWQCIADDGFRHYDQHYGSVKRWLEAKRPTTDRFHRRQPTMRHLITRARLFSLVVSNDIGAGDIGNPFPTETAIAHRYARGSSGRNEYTTGRHLGGRNG